MGEQFYVKRLWNVSEGSLGPRDQCRVTQVIGSHSCTAIPEAKDHPWLGRSTARVGWEVKILEPGTHQCG